MTTGPITVTVVSSTSTPDPYGDATTTTGETTLNGVLFAPRSSQERVDSRSPAVITAAALYIDSLPSGVTLDSNDSIRIFDVHPLIDGTYQVEGIPGFWGGPVEVAIKRTGGV